MVETVNQSTFNFSSDYTPSYSFASVMRTCYANNKIPSKNSGSSESSNSSSSNATNSSSPNTTSSSSNLDSRRSSCNEMYLRNLDFNCNNKRCSNTITTTCLNNSSTKPNNKPKLQLTTTCFEDNKNNLLSSCTTQLSTPQSNGMISQKHQFTFDNAQNRLGQRMLTSSGAKQKRSESLGFYRQCSEINDNNNNLITSSFDVHENSNSSEDDLVFGELSSSPSLHHNHQPRNSRQFGNTFVSLCKRCNGSNSSLTSFSSISSSVSSTNNLNQFNLANNNNSQSSSLINPQDNLIHNLSHSLNQTFNFTSNYNSTNNLSTPQFGRSRHNSINSLTLGNNGNAVQQADPNLHALHKALHNIFSN